MTPRANWTLASMALAITISAPLLAQTNRESNWSARTPWGDPDRQGEWTTEGDTAYRWSGRRSSAHGRSSPTRSTPNGSKTSKSAMSAIWPASMCCPAKSKGPMRRSRTGANTTRPRADVARHQSAGRPSASAHPAGEVRSATAMRQPRAR
jgi:hypothetical protein